MIEFEDPKKLMKIKLLRPRFFIDALSGKRIPRDSGEIIQIPAMEAKPLIAANIATENLDMHIEARHKKIKKSNSNKEAINMEIADLKSQIMLLNSEIRSLRNAPTTRPVGRPPKSNSMMED
jgi:hypothetical protein